VKTRILIVSLVALAAGIAGPATAGIRPYLRASFGGSQLAVDNLNDNIADDEQSYRQAGYPVELERVGVATGPDMAAGLWLTNWVRIGATYGRHEASARNDFWIEHQTIGYHRVDDLEVRIVEVGGEIMLRAERFAGISVGAQVANGRARLSENFNESDFSSEYHLRGSAERTRVNWAAFVGLDQTNEMGFVGYLRAGYRFRDYGSMPGRVTESDASTSVTYDTMSIPLDFSGFFVSLGVGYDFGRSE